MGKKGLLMHNMDLDITEEKAQEGVRLIIKGRIDSNNASILEQKLEDALNKGEKHIILNMSQVEHLRSVGIRIILKAYKNAREAGGKVGIEQPSKNVKKVLAITSLEEMLIL